MEELMTMPVGAVGLLAAALLFAAGLLIGRLRASDFAAGLGCLVLAAVVGSIFWLLGGPAALPQGYLQPISLGLAGFGIALGLTQLFGSPRAITLPAEPATQASQAPVATALRPAPRDVVFTQHRRPGWRMTVRDAPRIELRYRDAGGTDTRRVIQPRSVEGSREGDDVYPQAVIAFCEMRKEGRTFRLERILVAADAETGEVIPDLAVHLARWRVEPARSEGRPKVEPED